MPILMLSVLDLREWYRRAQEIDLSECSAKQGRLKENRKKENNRESKTEGKEEFPNGAFHLNPEWIEKSFTQIWKRLSF